MIKVERRAVIGAAWRLEETSGNSEDSSTVNSCFRERLNVTIRQGSAYLFRWTIWRAKWQECLEDYLGLFRSRDDLARPHRALKLG
jgi:hypothetical protein